MIKIPGNLINTELTPPSMLIGGEVSSTQCPMAVVKPLAGACGCSRLIIALPADKVLTTCGVCSDLMSHVNVLDASPITVHMTLI